MKPMTARERRLVALGLLMLALAAIYLLVLLPLVGGALNRASHKRDLRQAYQRNARVIASLPTLRAAAEAQRASLARFALTAPSEALAAEVLKERLQKLSADEGFAVRAIEDMQADAPQGAIKVRADLTLTLTQLYETIQRLQNEDAYVVIDYISINADRSAAARKLAPIDVRLELQTAWRPIKARG